MNTYQNSIVENKLNALHKDSEKDYMRIGRGIVKSIFRPIQPIDFKNAYLPITRSQGQFLKKLIVDNNCKNIVEFGTSFGISTIYLADAARQTGGKVISTELIESKAHTALQNVKDAGLVDFVEIKIGDAMKTLKGNAEPIDFLFLDGWKDLYQPLFQMLEPQFHKGTLIYSDNMDMQGTKQFADYLLSKKTSYATQIVDGGKAFLSTTL